MENIILAGFAILCLFAARKALRVGSDELEYNAGFKLAQEMHGFRVSLPEIRRCALECENVLIRRGMLSYCAMKEKVHYS